jgi:Tol biopolymer transport system component
MKLKSPVAATQLLVLVSCGSPPVPHAAALASPTGTISFSRTDASGDQYAFTIRADGSREKRLVTTQSCCVKWSHKGDRLLMAASALPPDQNLISTATCRADGSGYSVLPLDSSGLNLGPGAWSRDDSRIAFEGWDDSKPSRNGIYTADATTGQDRRRVTTTATTAQHDIPLSYSPDGSTILFWRGPADNDELGQLFLVAVEGGKVTQVSPPGMTVWAGHGDPGGWSPSGAQISFAAFSATPSDPGQSAVFVAAGDGSNPRRISDWGRYTTSARWSPTGSWIVFDRIAGDAGHGLFLVHPDGSGTRTISSLAGVCCAVWSPDGNRLLFPKGSSDQTTDLWTVMIDGSRLTRVTHTPTELNEISWSSATS